MASGEDLGFLYPADGHPPPTNPALPDWTFNGILYLSFDETTPQLIVFPWHLPTNYAGGGLDIDSYFFTTTATGDVDIDIDVDLVDVGGATDIDTDSYDTVTSVDGTTLPTAKRPFIVTHAIPDSALDGAVAGDPIKLRKKRDTADTLAAALLFVQMHIKET